MKKLININLLIILIGVISPTYVSYVYNKNHFNDFRFTLQYITSLVILLSSLYLIFINLEYLKHKINNKTMAIIFFVAASLLFLYSAGTLFLLYGFRHGVGF